MKNKIILKVAKTFTLLFLFSLKSFSQDSMQVFFSNPFFVDHIEIYQYKSRDIKFLMASIDPGYVNKNLKFNEKSETNFWIYRKNRIWFTGRWIPINAGYMPERTLLIQYSKARKRRYCYEYLWIEGNLPLKPNKM